MACAPAWCQNAPRAMVRIEVSADSAPVAGASVSVNGASYRTDATGLVVVPVAAGEVTVRVTKEGFLPAAGSVSASDAQEAQLIFDLKADEGLKQEITVSA